MVFSTAMLLNALGSKEAVRLYSTMLFIIHLRLDAHAWSWDARVFPTQYTYEGCVSPVRFIDIQYLSGAPQVYCACN